MREHFSVPSKSNRRTCFLVGFRSSGSPSFQFFHFFQIMFLLGLHEREGKLFNFFAPSMNMRNDLKYPENTLNETICIQKRREMKVCSFRSWYCARHNFPYIRGWMQMVFGTKWFIFLKQIIQWNTILVMIILYNCYTTYNNTHSVHKRLLKMWRARLLRLWPSRYVYPPPLSEANCPPFPSPGGPGPPASKMASFSPGSTHTPSPLSVTGINSTA